MQEYNGMLDYNGWININMNAGDNSDRDDLVRFRNGIMPHIEDFNKYTSRSLSYQTRAWDDVCFISGQHNHASAYFEDVIKLYKTIGEGAPGSYGLLYVHQSEDPVYWNKFRVFRLAKGVLTEHEDLLLSPCNPVIEDD